MKYYMSQESWKIDNYVNLMKRIGHNLSKIEDADFLLLSGGIDIGLNESRDLSERELYDLFVSNGKPVIGICRGMQFMLVTTGGKIIPHIPDVVNEIQHTTVTEHYTGESSWHKTSLGLYTNSRHHQGFIEVPNGWEVIDRTNDNIVEAVKKGNQFGVQWHPEISEMDGTLAQDWFINNIDKIIKN